MTIGAREGDRNLLAPPPALLEALRERCRVMASSASGRVLQLPESGVEAVLLSECEGGPRYDTILSFVSTPRVADLDGFVAALGRILADGGWILMVEPSRSGNGLSHSWLPSRLRHHSRKRYRPAADVLSALRAGGFTVTDLHRGKLQSVPVQWRRYVEIRARRESLQASRP